MLEHDSQSRPGWTSIGTLLAARAYPSRQLFECSDVTRVGYRYLELTMTAAAEPCVLQEWSSSALKSYTTRTLE